MRKHAAALLIVESLFIIASYDMHATYAVVVINLHLRSIHVMVYCCIFMCYIKLAMMFFVAFFHAVKF